MATGDLVVEDYQVEFNGILFGNGQNEIVDFDLLNSAEMRTGDTNRSRADGQFPGEDYYGGRTINMSVEVWGLSDADIATRLQNLLAATSKLPSEIQLVTQLPGWSEKVTVNCRPRRRAGPVIAEDLVVGRKGAATIQFHATDPRIYGLTVNSVTVAVGVAGGGLPFAAVAPFVFGAPGTAGIAACTNTGTYDTFPTATFTATGGSLTNPSVEHVALGKVISFTGVISENDTLVVDFHNKTVLLNGTASRYLWIDDPSQWFELQPGANELRFIGVSPGASTMNVTWQNAWA